MIYKIKYIAFPLCFVLLMLFINSSTFYMPVNVSVELKTNKADMYQLFYEVVINRRFAKLPGGVYPAACCDSFMNTSI